MLADVDVEKAVSVGAFGSFNHAGQMCMATSRHLVAASIAPHYGAVLAERADRITVGDPTDPATGMGPIIDAAQRDNIHRIVTSSVEAGATLAAGGDLRRSVPSTDRYPKSRTRRSVGPVAPCVLLESTVGRLASRRLSWHLTRDVMKGLELAERIPSGLVHINDQTVNDEALIPFGGVGESGTGSRHGGTQANLDAFTDVQWVTMRGDPPNYPF